MPAFSTHHLFADSMANKIQQADPSFSLNRDALFYGTQGPDFLFTHRLLPNMIGKSLRPLGSELHHCDPAKLFYYMGEYWSTQPCDKDIVKSYIYGFVCHFSLDRITHPYVYALQKRITAALHAEKFPTLVIHNKIELNLDMLLLGRSLKKTDTRGFRTYEVLKNDAHMVKEIAQLMYYTISHMGLSTAGIQDYETAFWDMRAVQKFLTDEKGLLNIAASILQAPLLPFKGPFASCFLRKKAPDFEWDYLNEKKKPWIPPAFPNTVCYDSFCELFTKAQEDALHIISDFDTALKEPSLLDSLTENMSFDSGARFDVAVNLH